MRVQQIQRLLEIGAPKGKSKQEDQQLTSSSTKNLLTKTPTATANVNAVVDYCMMELNELDISRADDYGSTTDNNGFADIGGLAFTGDEKSVQQQKAQFQQNLYNYLLTTAVSCK